ncbi:ethanolamine utilization protein EutJ, partial [Escherichia coli]
MSALLRRVEGGGDLGTANIAIVVLDEDNQPVAGVMYPSNVVKDGVVVDYL